MPTKEYPLIPLFEKFIRYSLNGKRLKPDGSRIRPQTVVNYRYVLSYLKAYELKTGAIIRIKPAGSTNKRLITAERNYWKKFYLDFTAYLYQEKQCYDNYTGAVIKVIRIFFNFIEKDLGIPAGNFHKSFYVRKEEVPIVTLMPEQLQFLINNHEFDASLSRSLRKTKDIFVFGCTVALRVSDLFAIKFSDIEEVGGQHYLPVTSIKTSAAVRIKLPAYCMEIIRRFRETAKRRKTIFPPIPLSRFNAQLKEIACLAGWTQAIAKQRSRRGVGVQVSANPTRFCDMVSSHTMRRTAITTMLMLGMKEHVVKKISGHASDSKSFYRYVNLVQSYLDNEMDTLFNKLAEVA